MAARSWAVEERRPSTIHPVLPSTKSSKTQHHHDVASDVIHEDGMGARPRRLQRHSVLPSTKSSKTQHYHVVYEDYNAIQSYLQRRVRKPNITMRSTKITTSPSPTFNKEFKDPTSPCVPRKLQRHPVLPSTKSWKTQHHHAFHEDYNAIRSYLQRRVRRPNITMCSTYITTPSSPTFNEEFVFDVQSLESMKSTSVVLSVVDEADHGRCLGAVKIGGTETTEGSSHQWDRMMKRPGRPVVQWHSLHRTK